MAGSVMTSVCYGIRSSFNKMQQVPSFLTRMKGNSTTNGAVNTSVAFKDLPDGLKESDCAVCKGKLAFKPQSDQDDLESRREESTADDLFTCLPCGHAGHTLCFSS